MIELTDDHQYYVDGVPYVSVTQVIADAGLYGDASRFYTQQSAERGRIVHKIIESHQGIITCSKGEKTIFNVRLPMAVS